MKAKPWIFILTVYSIYAQDAPEEVCSSIYTQDAPEVAWTIAKMCLRPTGTYGEHDFDQDKTEFGLKKSTSLSDLSIGSPFKEYQIHSDSLKKSAITTSVCLLLATKHKWYFPVLENGQMKFVIIIYNKNGTWKLGARGGMGFMLVWQKVSDAWPSSNGYHPTLISYGKLHYFHVPEVDAYNLTRILMGSDDRGHFFSKKTASEYRKVTSFKDVKAELER